MYISLLRQTSSILINQEKMKKDKIVYWICIGLVSVGSFFAAVNYLSNDEIKQAFVHLGFPDYFRVELAIAKMLGVIVLLIPTLNSTIRQFAFFGFSLSYISAFIAHLSIGDPIQDTVAPLFFLSLLVVAYIYNSKLGYTEAKTKLNPIPSGS